MTESDRTVGLVKWFNSKYGYGFITALEGDKKDIFVHYTAIGTADSQYKYLVQGEYVEFNLEKSTNENHEFQAVNISGIKGGPIMCETRRLNKQDGEDGQEEQQEVVQKPLKKMPSNTRGNAPRQVSTPSDGFTTIDKKKRKPVKPRKNTVPSTA
jgi:CspA family cold shock protein